MSKELFENQSTKEVQNNFFEELAGDELNGTFAFGRAMKFDKSEKTLVLFQYDNHIIGLAKLVDIYQYKDGECENYTGEYQFEEVQTISEPVTRQEISSIWNKIERFGQAKPYLEPEKFPDFLDLIKCRVDSIKELV